MCVLLWVSVVPCSSWLGFVACGPVWVSPKVRLWWLGGVCQLVFPALPEWGLLLPCVGWVVPRRSWRRVLVGVTLRLLWVPPGVGCGPCGCLPRLVVGFVGVASHPSWLGPVAGVGGGGPMGLASGSFLLRSAGGCAGWSLCLFRWGPSWWCSLPWLVAACRLLLWGGWHLVPPGRGPRRCRPPPLSAFFCFAPVLRRCRLCGSVPLPAAAAVSTAPWLVVCPFPGGGPVPTCLGGSFVGPGGGLVAAVVRVRWLQLVAGPGWVVYRFLSGEPYGCCPWSRLAGGFPT